MAWWDVILEFLLGILNQAGYILGIQFLDLAIFWQLLPIYSGWFAIQFITGGKEGEAFADRFMNGFTLLWVGFQLGEYIIQNFFTDPGIWYKTLIVVGLILTLIFGYYGFNFQIGLTMTIIGIIIIFIIIMIVADNWEAFGWWSCMGCDCDGDCDCCDCCDCD